MTFDALPAASTFPDTPLGMTAELQLAGTWTDITTYLPKSSLVISRGSPDESATITPSGLPLVLNNRGGTFVPSNPLGPFYGLLGLNTPLRVSIPEGASYLRSEVDQVSYAAAPDTAGI